MTISDDAWFDVMEETLHIETQKCGRRQRDGRLCLMANEMMADTVVYRKFTPQIVVFQIKREEHLFCDEIRCKNTDFRYCKYYVNNGCNILSVMLA